MRILITVIEYEKAKWVTEATIMGRRMSTVHLYQGCPIPQAGLWGLTCSVSATPHLSGLCLPSIQSKTDLLYVHNPTTWLSLGLLYRFKMQDTTGSIFNCTTKNTEEIISHEENTWQIGIRNKQINSSLFLSLKDCPEMQFFKKLIVRWFYTTITKSGKAY